MSDAPVSPASTPAAAPAPAKLTAIQTVEQEVSTWLHQKEQMIENIKALDGAIQGGNRLLGLLRAEVAKAEAEVEKLASEVEKAL